MPVTEICIQCGKVFTHPPSRNQRHCSDECARKTQAINRTKTETRVCIVCGKEFTVSGAKQRRRGKVCSYECLCKFRTGKTPANKLPRENRKCNVCGKQFEVAINSKQKYCSRDCADKARRGTKAWNSGTATRVKVKCEWCDREIEINPIRQPDFRFCSRKCQAEAKSAIKGEKHPLYNRIERTCEWCEAKFLAKPAKIKAGEARFCSRECLGAYTTWKQNGRSSSLETIVEVYYRNLDTNMKRRNRLVLGALIFIFQA